MITSLENQLVQLTLRLLHYRQEPKTEIGRMAIHSIGSVPWIQLENSDTSIRFYPLSDIESIKILAEQAHDISGRPGIKGRPNRKPEDRQ